MIDTKTFSWAAGFLDGEGHYGFYGTQLLIRAAQVERAPLYRLKKIFGGRINGPYRHKNKKHSDYYYYCAGGGLAAGIIMTLYPLSCGPKRKQMLTALRKWKKQPVKQALRKACPQGHAYTPENTYHRPDHKTWRGCRACNGRTK